MSEKKLTIFHINRKNGTSIFLYPFNKKQNLIELIDTSQIIGLYGKEPRIESLTLLRNDLYRLIEQAVKDWRAEKKFLPRFLISILVFLLVYFILSVVIKDPIPMIDEIIGGSVGAILTYLFLVKRDSDSRISTEMKVRLRTRVDEIVFNEDDFTRDVEQYLQHCETSADMKQLLMNMMEDESGLMFDYSDREKVREMQNSIKLLFDESDIKKHEKLLKKLTDSEDNTVGNSRMIKWMSSRKVDPFLFAVYARITKNK